MKYIFVLLPVILSILSTTTYSQTSEYGNLEIYSRETSFSSFGYFSGSFPLTTSEGSGRIDLRGVNYTQYYDITKIASIVPTSQFEINFLLKGAFKIGGAIGEKEIDNSKGTYPNNSIKYYMINADFFTLSFQPEATYVFNDGYALTLFLGFDLINVGGSGAILEGGVFSKHSIASINLIPLSFRPGIYFDFGRSALGIAGQINTSNIFEYRILSNELYSGINGAQTLDAFIRKFEFQLLYTF
jgi:hypothetical protein